MPFIADFHIHSHFSLATSKELIPEYLDYWARIKGIKVIGTGDFTHPGWIQELQEKLEPSEPGLFRLKREFILNPGYPAHETTDPDIHFMLTAEISTIYKKDGAIRKVHHVIFAPDFDTVGKIRQKLIHLGANLSSDGRPIIGLDSRDLLEIALDSSPEILFVPAHIWTPWFSVLGDKSGFDSIDACFGDLAHHIYAVETGLSTDPPMNWMCKMLDRYTLLSNSDAHSPDRLGRNANRFNTELSYTGITQAIKTGNPDQCLGTIDLFPQEGKYHYDGHRKCGVCWNPVETLKHQGICTCCGKKVTIGVMNRVAQLADRPDPEQRPNRLPFHSIIPLRELLSEIHGVGQNSRKIVTEYQTLIQKCGSEFNLLIHLPLDTLRKKIPEILCDAIDRMRSERIYISEGYDGEYGQIRVFSPHETASYPSQDDLFLTRQEPVLPPRRNLLNFKLPEFQNLHRQSMSDKETPHLQTGQSSLFIPPPKSDQPELFSPRTDFTTGLNPEQIAALTHDQGPLLIIAGPGTGKTKVLTHRIAHLIMNKQVSPDHILAVTFTKKAAMEMTTRITELVKRTDLINRLTISTFHAFGYRLLKSHSQYINRRPDFSIVDEDDKIDILKKKLRISKHRLSKIASAISLAKQNIHTAAQLTESMEDRPLSDLFSEYESMLQNLNAVDLDDLIYKPVLLLMEQPEILSRCQQQYRWILIDEYQDINLAQYRLVRFLMPGADNNICVIGDPDQAIYGFRGADAGYIQSFKKDYPSAALYILKRSYRCSRTILKASSNVVRGNHDPDHILEGVHSGVNIKITPQPTDKSEAEFIGRTIEQMIGGLRFFSMDSAITKGNEEAGITSLSDFAVLCRANHLIPPIEKAFQDHSIPYQLIGELPFYKREPINWILEILAFSVNPDDLLRRERLSSSAFPGAERLRLAPVPELNGSVVEELDQIIRDYFSDVEFAHREPLRLLRESARSFDMDYRGFLDQMRFGSGVDMYRPDTEQVALMTLHMSKGLEFNCVFIPGCEQGMIPYSVFPELGCNMEEERRLLYVGMTRAKQYLFLTHAMKRMVYGREYRFPRSEFLDWINQDIIDLMAQAPPQKRNRDSRQLDLF